MGAKTTYESPALSGPVPYPFIEVVWDDAAASTGWKQAPKKDVLDLCLTVGFLVYSGEESIVVASTIGEGKYDNNCRIKIPVGMIKHIREI